MSAHSCPGPPSSSRSRHSCRWGSLAVPTLIAAVLGAIIGDGASYLLGWRYKRGILTMWPFSRYPALVERSTAFFNVTGRSRVSSPRPAADPRLRAGHGRRAVDAAATFLSGQCRGHRRMGHDLCWCRGARWVGLQGFRRIAGEYGLAILVGVVALYLAYRIARRFIANRRGGEAALRDKSRRSCR